MSNARCKIRYAVLLMAIVTVLSGCVAKPKPEELSSRLAAYKIYDSHMVLQQGEPIRISGIALPGKYVRVSFAGKTVYAQAGVPSGEWTAMFPPMKVGGPYEIVISGAKGGDREVFEDVLIGEVWMCSGQSNMEMPLWSDSSFWRAANASEELKNSANSKIRFYSASSRKKVSPFLKLRDPNGPGWEVCGPDTIGKFSALGYFFARDLQKKLNVPVGIICTAWSGSRVEAWISEEKLQEKHCNTLLDQRKNALAEYEADDEQVNKLRNARMAELKKWRKAFDEFNPDATERAKNRKEAAFDDSKWSKAAIPGGFGDGIHGVGWYRCTFDLPAEFVGKDLVLNLGPIDDCDTTYFNGKFVGGIDDFQNPTNYWNIPRVYNIPAVLAKAGRTVIAVRVLDFGGGSGLTAGSVEELKLSLKSDPKNVFTLRDGWKFAMEFKVDPAKLGPRPSLDLKRSFESSWLPSTLYNGLISPWFTYPVRGVLWYQGCSNAGQEAYYNFLNWMIEDWRAAYGKPDLPFLIVQLAGYERHTPSARPPEDAWLSVKPAAQPSYALTREIQAAVVADGKNLGMAAAMDVGDQFDIHPRDKQSLGKRLTAEAMRLAYGSKELSRGPIYRSMKAENGKVRVAFDNVGKGLVTKDGKAPGAFALAGADGVLYWANAVIDGDTVVVSCPEVPEPKIVRYAFCSYRGDVNLMNSDGFPAEPFRSDAPNHKKLNQEK